MTLPFIALFVIIAFLYAALVPNRWRGWVLLIISVFGLYALQPDLPIRWLDYSLPTVMLSLAIVVWLFTKVPEEDNKSRFSPEDRVTLLMVVGLALILALPRYISLPDFLQLTDRPPEIVSIMLGMVIAAAFVIVIWRGLRDRNSLYVVSILAIVGIFVVMKTEFLATVLSGLLRSTTGQDTSIASAVDLEWLGFSYVAFRLIHTLRDRQSGKLPSLNLREYLTYIIFFPAITAGPIDRVERFIEDDRSLSSIQRWDATRFIDGGTRIVMGLFKKFVVADTLALIALNATNAEQATSAGGLWILLYAYAFRLFFDFSGYSDIAIGIGILVGIRLPENFDRPYLKNNITSFWQSWHMTLSNWVRFYVFTPLSRWLLTRETRPSTNVILLIAHLSTMVVIGLWHGITLPFVIWGVWHGFGLFVHKLWSDRTRKWYRELRKNEPRRLQLWTWAGILITFHFVVIGWVWFALPDAGLAWNVFLRLFGIGS